MRFKLTVLCLLFCLQLSYAQHVLSYSQVVKPETKDEQRLFAAYDTTLSRFLDNYSHQKGEPYLYLYSSTEYFGVAKTIEEYKSLWKSRLSSHHEIFGLWNHAFDTLEVLSFFNLYDFKLPNTYEEVPCNVYYYSRGGGSELVDSSHWAGITPSLGDTSIVNPKALAPVLNYVKRKIFQKLKIEKVNDTLLLSTYHFPIDTVVLPQVSFSFYGDILDKAVSEGYLPYYDKALLNPISSKSEAENLKTISDTVEGISMDYLINIIPTQTDSLNIQAFWDSIYKQAPKVEQVIGGKLNPKCISVTYRWHFSQPHTDRYQITPGMVLSRKPYSIGIEYENGNQIFYNYSTAAELFKKYKIPFVPIEQSFEAVLYKTLDVNPRRYFKCYREKK